MLLRNPQSGSPPNMAARKRRTCSPRKTLAEATDKDWNVLAEATGQLFSGVCEFLSRVDVTSWHPQESAQQIPLKLPADAGYRLGRKVFVPHSESDALELLGQSPPSMLADPTLELVSDVVVFLSGSDAVSWSKVNGATCTVVGADAVWQKMLQLHFVFAFEDLKSSATDGIDRKSFPSRSVNLLAKSPRNVYEAIRRADAEAYDMTSSLKLPLALEWVTCRRNFIRKYQTKLLAKAVGMAQEAEVIRDGMVHDAIKLVALQEAAAPGSTGKLSDGLAQPDYFQEWCDSAFFKIRSRPREIA